MTGLSLGATIFLGCNEHLLRGDLLLLAGFAGEVSRCSRDCPLIRPAVKLGGIPVAGETVMSGPPLKPQSRRRMLSINAALRIASSSVASGTALRLASSKYAAS